MISFLFFNVGVSKSDHCWGIWAVTIRVVAWALSTLGLFCLAAAPAQAAAYVLGDSLGLGVSRAGKLKNLSKISIHIRGRKMQEQIAKTPPGSTVFLVLGTNDAEGSIARLDKHIDRLVEAVKKKNITMIWLGPPCVRKAWDTRARDLDEMLQSRFENTAVRYVSMRDEAMCSGALHERDGVHLKMKGYAHMWERAREASGFAVAAEEAEPEVTRTGSKKHAAIKTASVGTTLKIASVSSSKSKKAQRIPLPVPRKPLPQ
jgi:lysophospholipase L1-like esterase